MPRPNKIPSRIAVFATMELLGGGVMISAVMKTLSLLYPDATIYLVGERHRTGKLEEFFRKHSWVDDIIYCPPRNGTSVVDWVRFYRQFRRYQVDMCLLAPNHSCSNSVFLYLCGIPEIAGADLPHIWTWQGNIENRFLTRRLTAIHLGHDRPYRQLDFPQAYARMLTGDLTLRLEQIAPYVRFKPPGSLQALNGLTVSFYAGGTASTQWGSDNFTALSKLVLRHHGATILLIGGPHEAEIAAKIRHDALAECPDGHVFNFCGASLNETLNYIARSLLLVGNNGGVIQLAVATGVPVIALLRNDDVRFSGPDAAGHTHVSLSRAQINQLTVQEVWEVVDLRLRWRREEMFRCQSGSRSGY
jgi:ADP-heptose:LPS heptosyltransferase